MYHLLQDGASSSERTTEGSFERVLWEKIGRISCAQIFTKHTLHATLLYRRISPISDKKRGM